jgi:5-methylcytosine-specific restriction endonuclease McrA
VRGRLRFDDLVPVAALAAAICGGVMLMMSVAIVGGARPAPSSRARASIGIVHVRLEREPARRPAPAPAPRATMTPVAKGLHTLTVTVDDEFRAKLADVTALLSHKVPDGNMADVLLEALRCAGEKYGKRRGALEPKRKASARPAAAPRSEPRVGREPIPAAVKRKVCKRDGGRCTYVAPDGTRCDSRWKLEFHHIHEAALGGPSTEENITLRCRPHNVRAAEATFGAEFMSQFRRGETPRAGELIEPGISAVDARQASLFATD